MYVYIHIMFTVYNKVNKQSKHYQMIFYCLLFFCCFFLFKILVFLCYDGDISVVFEVSVTLCDENVQQNVM